LFQFSLDKAWGKYKNKPVTTCTPNITSGLPSTSRDVNPVKNTELNEYLSDLYSVKKRPRLEDELQDYLAEPRELSDSSYDNRHTGKHTLLATLVSPAWHETTWPSLQPALPVSVYSALEKIFLAYAGFV
jgi:hypothetical protein